MEDDGEARLEMTSKAKAAMARVQGKAKRGDAVSLFHPIVWLTKLFKQRQRTFCYCPKCKNELCLTSEYVEAGEGVVLYRCLECGHRSAWQFDTPAPLLVGEWQWKVIKHAMA